MNYVKESEHNLYMNKFKNDYYVKKDVDGVFILEKGGSKIAPYDAKNGFLGLWHTTDGVKAIWGLKRALTCVVEKFHQEGDYEFGCYFHESKLDEVCKIAKIKKRRKLTEEQKLSRIERLKKYWFEKGSKNEQNQGNMVASSSEH